MSESLPDGAIVVVVGIACQPMYDSDTERSAVASAYATSIPRTVGSGGNLYETLDSWEVTPAMMAAVTSAAESDSAPVDEWGEPRKDVSGEQGTVEAQAPGGSGRARRGR